MANVGLIQDKSSGVSPPFPHPESFTPMKVSPKVAYRSQVSHRVPVGNEALGESTNKPNDFFESERLGTYLDVPGS